MELCTELPGPLQELCAGQAEAGSINKNKSHKSNAKSNSSSIFSWRFIINSGRFNLDLPLILFQIFQLEAEMDMAHPR